MGEWIVVDAEANAVAYCFNPYNGTRPMPDGFIKTAHFVSEVELDKHFTDPPKHLSLFVFRRGILLIMSRFRERSIGKR